MNKETSKQKTNIETHFDVDGPNCETGLADRIKAVIAGNVSAFSKKSGVGESLLRQYIAGSTPGLAKAAAIADAAGVSLNWLATGRGEPAAGVGEARGAYDVADNFVLVPRYDVAASAGHGALVDNEQIVDHLAFRRAWLAREGLQADKLALIQSRGDSMEPTIVTGDLLLVDLRENIPDQDGIYILRTDSHLVAKRIQSLFDGSIYIKSDNETYQTQQLDRDQAERLRIIGRVVWVARRI